MYLVKVKDTYRWPQAQVGGQIFTKTPVELGAVSDEILNSSLLEVVEVDDEPEEEEEAVDDEPEKEVEVDATKGAAELAKKNGIALGRVQGSGVGGRVVKGDVEALLLETS